MSRDSTVIDAFPLFPIKKDEKILSEGTKNLCLSMADFRYSWIRYKGCVTVSLEEALSVDPSALQSVNPSICMFVSPVPEWACSFCSSLKKNLPVLPLLLTFSPHLLSPFLLFVYSRFLCFLIFFLILFSSFLRFFVLSNSFLFFRCFHKRRKEIWRNGAKGK